MALQTLNPQPVFNLNRRRLSDSGPTPLLTVKNRVGTRIGPVRVLKKDVDMATLGNLCVDIVLSVPRLPPARKEERKAYMEQLAASPPDEGDDDSDDEEKKQRRHHHRNDSDDEEKKQRHHSRHNYDED